MYHAIEHAMYCATRYAIYEREGYETRETSLTTVIMNIINIVIMIIFVTIIIIIIFVTVIVTASSSSAPTSSRNTLAQCGICPLKATRFKSQSLCADTARGRFRRCRPIYIACCKQWRLQIRGRLQMSANEHKRGGQAGLRLTS